MNTTIIEAGQIAPLGFADALDLAAEENRRLSAVLHQITAAQWRLPTDCTAWTVRDLAGHLLGSLDVNSGLLRSARAWRRAGRVARRNATRQLDEATAAEVAAWAAVPDTEVAVEFDRLAARNIRGRRRIPAPIRRTAVDFDGTRLTVGQFAGVILLRDCWMHRFDLCRATGQNPALTTGHDGRIVADVVRDWARGHGQPFTLTLSGLAGGTYHSADVGPLIELDATEYCRILSGRGTGTGLLAHRVLF